MVNTQKPPDCCGISMRPPTKNLAIFYRQYRTHTLVTWYDERILYQNTCDVMAIAAQHIYHTAGRFNPCVF